MLVLLALLAGVGWCAGALPGLLPRLLYELFSGQPLPGVTKGWEAGGGGGRESFLENYSISFTSKIRICDVSRRVSHGWLQLATR